MELFAHQRRAVELLRTTSRHCLFWEPGTGKTIGTLAAIDDAKARGFTGSTLVLAPKSILWSAWAEDAKHFPALTVQVCWSESAAKRSKMIRQPADIYIINPASFKRHVEEFQAAGVRRIVVDESSCLKDAQSQISNAVYEFASGCESVILLSGTPAPNNDTEYFGQVRCIDSSLFGWSFWRFANNYFVPIKRKINGVERTIGWTPNRLRRDEFVTKLRQVSWALRTEECIDLPDQTDCIRHVDLDAEESRVYRELLDDLRVTWQDGATTNVNLNARTMKLRQATGGSVYDRGAARIVGASKMNALDELLGEIGTHQAVIWAEFTSEIDRIIEHLDGRNVGRIDGSVPADVRSQLIADFQAGRLKYLVCHPAAAGHGITLTAARYDIYYSLSFSHEQHEQSRKRTHRTGQRHPVTHYYLIARGTVDEGILKVLRRKADAADEMKTLLGNGNGYGNTSVSRRTVRTETRPSGRGDMGNSQQADERMPRPRGSLLGSAWQA